MDNRLNLASKRLGASVMATSDEHFGAAENLVKDSESISLRGTPGPRGTLYDGWESRRHSPDHEWALVRLGAPGVVREIVADTAHFRGNAPVAVEVEAATVDGYPTVDQVQESPRRSLVKPSDCGGDRKNAYPCDDDLIATHLWLKMLPDGGVSRLRAYGEVVLDPRRVRPCSDLASLAAGGHVVESSEAFMPPTNLLMPRTASCIDEGWETGRRRVEGCDAVVVGLADVAAISAIEVDTTHFGGNAPQEFSAEYLPEDAASDTDWQPLVPRTRLLQDQRHAFAATVPVESARVRVRIYPDGGIAAIRVFGDLLPRVRGRVVRRWLAALPSANLRVIALAAGVSERGVQLLLANAAEDRQSPVLAADASIDGLDTGDSERLDRIFFPGAAR